MNRQITITPDGGLVDVITGEKCGFASIDGSDALKREMAAPIEMMPGDPLLRERMQRLIARDCARRRLLWRLLPAINVEGRQVILQEIADWKDPDVAAAAHEILHLSGWLPLTGEEDTAGEQERQAVRERQRRQILGPDDGRIV
jgi:hypothetical protein